MKRVHLLILHQRQYEHEAAAAHWKESRAKCLAKVTPTDTSRAGFEALTLWLLNELLYILSLRFFLIQPCSDH